jgi:hypothetical protein
VEYAANWEDASLRDGTDSASVTDKIDTSGVGSASYGETGERIHTPVGIGSASIGETGDGIEVGPGPGPDLTVPVDLSGDARAQKGIDALVLVLSLQGRFTDEEMESVNSFKQLFGEECWRDRAILIWTHADALEVYFCCFCCTFWCLKCAQNCPSTTC